MGLTQTIDQARASIVNLVSGDALRAKTMRGGAWLGAGSVVEQVARFGRNMLLARLLLPGAFGTMAIVLSSASLVDAFLDVAVRAAIIQNPEGGKTAHLNAAWWIGMGRALVSYIIIFAVAPWIAGFYGRPELCGLLRISLLSVLLNGAMSPRSALAQRDMKLGRWAAISNGGSVCGVLLTILLSFLLRNVWALAIGYCAEFAFRLLLSYILCPGLPSLSLNWHAIKSILTFSQGTFGLAILNLIIARADVFVLGRLYPLTSLGLYTMAIALVMTPAVFLSNMLAQTLLPGFSSIQRDDERVNRILIEVTSWLRVGVPVAVFLSLTAPVVLRLAYGTRYAAAAGPLSVATAVAFFTVLNVAPSCALFAKGLPGLHREAVVVTAVTMLIAVYPASKFLGPMGAQIAALFGALFGYLLQLIRIHRVTRLNLIRYSSSFLLPGVGSLGMVGLVVLCRYFGLTTRPIADVAVCSITCLVVCGWCVSSHLRAARNSTAVFNPPSPQSVVTS